MGSAEREVKACAVREMKKDLGAKQIEYESTKRMKGDYLVEDICIPLGYLQSIRVGCFAKHKLR